MKSPQQIKNEVEKGCGKTADSFYNSFCGDIPKSNVNRKFKKVYCSKCRHKLSILTEYDKSIKEMIEDEIDNAKNNVPKGSSAEAVLDVLEQELLSKIGDNSEVEK